MRASHQSPAAPTMAGVLLLGHRGQNCSAEPENTVEAVRAALDGGADGVEVDVRLTADGVPVCVHDPDLRRIAWSGRQVAASTYAELQAIRLPGGHRVPTLTEVAAAVAGRGLLVVDLKEQRNAPALATAVVEVLDDLRDEVVVSSFATEVLDAVHRRRPALPRALITDADVPAVVALARAKVTGCAGLHPHVTTVLADHGIAERAEAQQVTLRCWTVNRSVDARLLDIAGATAVISDDPSGLRRALAAPSRNRVS
jgi:glycerophosphoryl diester phosphodiesterase